MSKKIAGEGHSPSWFEVIFGAVLSMALGVVLGAVLLFLRPVTTVKSLPKEADRIAGVVYYVEGSRESAKANQAAAKRKAFAQGKTISVTEDEINSFVAAPPPPPAKPKPGEKAAPAPAGAVAASGDMFAPGVPTFRIRDGVVQLGVPVKIDLFGLIDQKVFVVTRGSFVKKGDRFAFDPDSLYIGSCPMQRFPFAAGILAKKVLANIPVPEDIAAAWPKLADVTAEGNTLKLAMP